HMVDVAGRRREQWIELPGADDPEPDLGGEPGGGEDRLQAVQRDQLADEEAGERLPRRPPGCEDPLLGADEADGDTASVESGQPGEVLGVRLRIADDEVGRAE